MGKESGIRNPSNLKDTKIRILNSELWYLCVFEVEKS